MATEVELKRLIREMLKHVEDCCNCYKHSGKDLLTRANKAIAENITISTAITMPIKIEFLNLHNYSISFTRDIRHVYCVTHGQRKAWDGQPNLDELNKWKFVDFQRYDYHEEKLWKKKIKDLNDDDKDILWEYQV